MSCLESFKEMYFDLLSDIMKKVDSTNPMVRVVFKISFFLFKVKTLMFDDMIALL